MTEQKAEDFITITCKIPTRVLPINAKTLVTTFYYSPQDLDSYRSPFWAFEDGAELKPLVDYAYTQVTSIPESTIKQNKKSLLLNNTKSKFRQLHNELTNTEEFAGITYEDMLKLLESN
jgi:hypothetical protein